MARIKLEYGSGEIDVLVDLRNGRLVEYNDETSTRVHEEFGGAQYYWALSGLSGAGWVPAHPYLRKVHTLRWDVSRKWVPEDLLTEATIPGIGIIVLTNRSGSSEVGNLDREAPVVIWSKDLYDTTFTFVNPHSVGDVLRGELDIVEMTIEEHFYRHTGVYDGTDAPEGFSVRTLTHKIRVEARRGSERPVHFETASPRFILRELYRSDMQVDDEWLNEAREQTSEFFQRLGLVATSDEFNSMLRVRQGVAYEWMLGRNLEALDTFQEHTIGQRAYAISLNSYIQERDGQYQLVALASEEDRDYTVVVPLSVEKSMKAFQGNVDELDQMIEEQRAEDREAEERRKALGVRRLIEAGGGKRLATNSEDEEA